MIKSVKFVSIVVSDQERSLEFYTEKLGFDVVTNQPFGKSARWIELRPPGAETKVVLFPPMDENQKPGGFSNVVFLSDDVEATFRVYRDRGVDFVQTPSLLPPAWIDPHDPSARISYFSPSPQ